MKTGAEMVFGGPIGDVRRLISGNATSLRIVKSEDVTPEATSISPASHVSASIPSCGSAAHATGTFSFAGEKFSGGIPFLGASPLIDHSTARAEARHAFHNSTAARALVMRFVESVVGSGLRLKPRPAASVLGISQEQAELWARNTSDRFGLWSNSKQSTLSEEMNLPQLERLVSLNAERDGEYFARLNFLDDPDRISRLSVNLLEQGQIQGGGYTATQGLPWTSDGIERDERRREIAYQVTVKDAKGIWRTERIMASTGGRRTMLHGWCPEYAGQTRGYTPVLYGLQEFSQITGFQLAHVQKALLQSTVVLSKETAAGSVPTFGGIGEDVVGQLLAEASAPPTTPTESGPPCFSPVDARLPIGGFAYMQNGAGEKLVPFQSTAPSDRYSEFVEAVVKNLSAASGMPVEMVLLKFSDNYSASRAVLELAFRTFEIHRLELVSDFCQPVYEAWLSEEIAAGRISAPGWSDPTLRAAWLQCDWNGPEMVDIDPEKSVNASRLAIEAGLSDVNTEAQRHNGSNAAANIATNNRILKDVLPVPWAKKAEMRPTEQGAQNVR